MSKRIIIATLLALAVGSNAVLAADESKSAQAGATSRSPPSTRTTRPSPPTSS